MKQITLFAKGVGELFFDGRHAVVSALDVGYPQIRRVTVDTLERTLTQSVAVGEGKLKLEGYFLDWTALEAKQASPFSPRPDESDCASGATAPSTLPASAPGRAQKSGAARMRSLLSAIAAPGRAFTLTVGDRSRQLYASSLVFDSEAPFSSDRAERFTLEAFSDDPYFHGGEVSFFGVPRTEDALSLPASGEFSLGAQRNVGDVTIVNDGDETCGFIMEARFTESASEFVISSDREEGRAHLGETVEAGDTVVIDTRNGHKSVKLADGTDLLSSLNEKCAFFTAPPGKTKLSWRVYGAASPEVTVRLVPGYTGV